MRNYFIILLPVDENAFALWARINDDTLTESGEILKFESETGMEVWGKI